MLQWKSLQAAKMTDLIIIGAGGHGKVVADVARRRKQWSNISFLDDRFPELDSVLNFPVIGRLESLNKIKSKNIDVVVAIGDNQARLMWVKRINKMCLNLVNIIDPSAVISESAHIGAGTVVFPNAVINADASLGLANIINTSAQVEHDCMLSDGVHLSPGGKLGGNVTLGLCCWIGIGVSVKQGIHIGANTIVGVGAAVVDDLPDNIIAVGVPAKICS